MCNEPSCGAIEQHAGLIGARPAQSVKPAIESELDRAVRKIRISAALADSYRMIPSLPTRAVFAETCRILDAQLSSKDRQHRSRAVDGKQTYRIPELARSTMRSRTILEDTERLTNLHQAMTTARLQWTCASSLNLPKIALVGHDRGARVATRFAKDHPEVLERLVVMD